MSDKVTSIAVTEQVERAILAQAQIALPGECCGLLLGSAGRIEIARPTANVAADPLRFFEIDPQALIAAHMAARGGGPDLLGYYHSHPAGPAEPSPRDVAAAGHDGRLWAIAGQGRIGWWRDTVHGFVAVAAQVI